jgi:hypothetical protein
LYNKLRRGMISVALVGTIASQASAEQAIKPRTNGKSQLVWGVPIHGLQAGMELPRGTRRYPAGSLIPLSLYVRNTGNSPVTFSYSPDNIGTPRIVSRNGKQVLPQMPAMGGSLSVASHTLKPGARMLLCHTTLRLDTTVERYPATPSIEAKPGRYTLSYYTSLTFEQNSDTVTLLSSSPARFQVLRNDR